MHFFSNEDREPYSTIVSLESPTLPGVIWPPRHQIRRWYPCFSLLVIGASRKVIPTRVFAEGAERCQRVNLPRPRLGQALNQWNIWFLLRISPTLGRLDGVLGAWVEDWFRRGRFLEIVGNMPGIRSCRLCSPRTAGSTTKVGWQPDGFKILSAVLAFPTLAN